MKIKKLAAFCGSALISAIALSASAYAADVVDFENESLIGVSVLTEEGADNSQISIVDFNGSKALKVEVVDATLTPKIKFTISDFINISRLDEIAAISFDYTIASKDGKTPVGWAEGALGIGGENVSWSQSAWEASEYYLPVSDTFTHTRYLAYEEERFTSSAVDPYLLFQRWTYSEIVPYVMYLDNLTFYNDNGIAIDLKESYSNTEITNILIDSTSFPDANFRAYVSEYIDTNADGYLTDSEICDVTTIYVSHSGISDLTGIEYFTKIVYLDCYGNNLTSLDVSKNTALEWLSCSGNNLTSLDVSKNTALEVLSCDGNNLTSLDVSKNTALEVLSCGGNNLTSLDVSKNTALEELSCDGNNLTSLDVSKNTALGCLWCYDNNLTSLDVSKNTALVYLDCYGNNLTSLDATQNTALVLLYCWENNLTSLDVSKNTALVYLDCSGNNLTSLDVSKNTALGCLWCCDNNLTSLDVSNCTALEWLSCYGNNLTSLDVSKNTALCGFGCNNNSYIIDKSVSSLSLSELPGFDASKASNWTGCTYNASNNKISNFTSDVITYTYDCGGGYSETFSIIKESEAFELSCEGIYSLIIEEDKTPLLNTMQLNVDTVYNPKISELLPDSSYATTYDIYVTDKNHNIVELNGVSMTIGIPVYNGENSAYYFDGEKLERLECKVIDGIMYITTDHLSNYVVAKMPETEFIYGDLNDDGYVNKKDSLLLKMYLADDTTEINIKAADVYADGSINKKDSLYLKQYLAGIDIELGN